MRLRFWRPETPAPVEAGVDPLDVLDLYDVPETFAYVVAQNLAALRGRNVTVARIGKCWRLTLREPLTP